MPLLVAHLHLKGIRQIGHEMVYLFGAVSFSFRGLFGAFGAL